MFLIKSECLQKVTLQPLCDSKIKAAQPGSFF
jgi:hypothetical protein